MTTIKIIVINTIESLARGTCTQHVYTHTQTSNHTFVGLNKELTVYRGSSSGQINPKLEISFHTRNVLRGEKLIN